MSDAASLRTSTVNGVQIYNVSAGKSLPQWLKDSKNGGNSAKALKKDEDFRRRVEIIQDLEFPIASQRVKVTPDGRHLISTGVYKPRVRIYDLSQLSMKVERHMDAEVVQFAILGSDFSKLAFLHDDRSVTIHAKYGFHQKLRLPVFGRDCVYSSASATLYAVGASPEIYRLNLELGRWMEPWQTGAGNNSGINCTAESDVHGLLGFGCENGVVECFDARANRCVGRLPAVEAVEEADGQLRGPAEITALAFDPSQGLTLACGTSHGAVALFDLRRPVPFLVRRHQYQNDAIRNLHFHGYGTGAGSDASNDSSATRRLVSVSRRQLKIWDTTTGQLFTAIEPGAAGDFSEAAMMPPDSGLIIAAGEFRRHQCYYIPALGSAPAWCGFLDSLTEEMEESRSTALYDDYRFVTREELASLGLEALIGSNALRAYMHGYFISTKLYERSRQLNDPQAFERFQKEKIQRRLEEIRNERISKRKRLPVAQQPTSAQNGDNRFAAMMSNPDFKVDTEAEEYKRKGRKGRERERERERENEEEEREERDAAFMERFEEVEDGSSDSELEEMLTGKRRHNRSKKRSSAQNADKPDKSSQKSHMYALKSGGNVIDISGGANESLESVREESLRRTLPFAERLRRVAEKEGREKERERKGKRDGVQKKRGRR